MDYRQVETDPCPHCGVVGRIDLLKRTERVKVRGSDIDVPAEYFHCSACGADFEAAQGPDTLELAYRAFREQVGLVQPEALKNWRESLGLKQAELATMLGWSTATVSRYENGALQDDAHDRSMKAAMTPDGLAELVRFATGLSDKTREQLEAHVSQLLGSASQLTAVVRSRLGRVAHKALDWKKVSETVVFFCQGKPVSRTKLNKLLFYADFLHVKYFGPLITGLPYVRLQHGPVPDDYELLFAALRAQGDIDITESEFEEKVAYLHKAKRGPDITVFVTSELQALIKVRSLFEKANATEISERSHTEDAWIRTAPGERVSLNHANSLSIAL